MIRALVYVAAIAAVSMLAVWLAERPGQVSLVWQGYRVDSSVAVLALAVAISAVVVALAYELYRWLIVGPRRLWTWRLERRRRRGYRALTRGLVAAAAGDGSGARKAADDAQALLGEPPLTLLLTAQAAQLDGDHGAAAAAFRDMLAHRETEFLGLRGLLTQAVRNDDGATALKLARQAFAINPDAGWVLSNLIELESANGNWAGADRAVESAMRTRRLTRAEGARKRALFAFQRARTALGDGNPQQALSSAREALNRAPDFVPAAILAADLLLEADRRRDAQRLIARTWSRSPHPELARLYVAAARPQSALDRVKAVEALVKANPEALESRFAIAAAALDAELWGTARHHLSRLDDDAYSARLCRLRARLEEADEGDAGLAREWWRRASTAAPDPAWVCTRCGTPSGEWQLVCASCGMVDGQAWKTPPAAVAVPAAIEAAAVGENGPAAAPPDRIAL